MENPICIECRTALGPGERCDGGPRHHTTPLDTPDGREVLLREVWGPPGLRRQARQMAVAGGGGAATGTVLEGSCGALECVGSVGDLGPVIVILGLAAAGALIYREYLHPTAGALIGLSEGQAGLALGCTSACDRSREVAGRRGVGVAVGATPLPRWCPPSGDM